jgi:predicted deacetylase
VFIQVFDRSGEFTMLYANSRLDKSDEVLETMGVARKVAKPRTERPEKK